MIDTPARIAPPGTRTQRGFTLVEMTVAVAVLSLIMLATVTALRTLGATQGSLEVLTRGNDEIRSVSSFLRDALELSVVSGGGSGGLSLGGGGGSIALFETTPDSVVWTTALRFGESAGGSYVARVGREGERIVLRWQLPNREGRLAPWNKAPSRTLIDKVQSFEVAYRREAGGDWQRDWDRRGAPGWLRLRVQARERYWPDLVMSVAR
jgi:general secretion pathway protein J